MLIFVRCSPTCRVRSRPLQIRPVPAYPSGVAVAFATLFWLLPMLLVVGVLAAVLAGAPWLLWGVLWVVILMKIFGRRHRYHSHRPRH